MSTKITLSITSVSMLSCAALVALHLCSCGSSGGGGAASPATPTIDLTCMLSRTSVEDPVWRQPPGSINWTSSLIQSSATSPVASSARWIAKVNGNEIERGDITLSAHDGLQAAPTAISQATLKAAFPSGIVTVTLTIDPDQLIAETDETNNSSTVSFNVRQSFDGDYTGQVDSDASQSISFTVFNHTYLSLGHLYAKHAIYTYSQLDLGVDFSGVNIGNNGTWTTTGSDTVTFGYYTPTTYYRSWSATISFNKDGVMSTDLDYTIRLGSITASPSTTHRHYTQTAPPSAPFAIQ